jgi:hypothetical protein
MLASGCRRKTERDSVSREKKRQQKVGKVNNKMLGLATQKTAGRAVHVLREAAVVS